MDAHLTATEKIQCIDADAIQFQIALFINNLQLKKEASSAESVGRQM